MARQEKVRNALILSGFGSVRNYQVHQVGNRELPPKDIFVKDPTAPTGIIGDEWGRDRRQSSCAYHAGEFRSRIWWPP
jgi:hypothetical protein